MALHKNFVIVALKSITLTQVMSLAVKMLDYPRWFAFWMCTLGKPEYPKLGNDDTIQFPQ